jgi:hypothetical protein
MGRRLRRYNARQRLGRSFNSETRHARSYQDEPEDQAWPTPKSPRHEYPQGKIHAITPRGAYHFNTFAAFRSKSQALA